MVIEYLEGRGNGGGLSYEATVNGIDVYGSNMLDDRSVLFSGRDLLSVTHHELADGHPTTVTFTCGENPHNGTLTVRFDQTTQWRNAPIVEFVIGETYGQANNQQRL